MAGMTRGGAAWMQASWDLKARTEHLRCDVCSALAAYPHRHDFYATGLCEFCVAHLQPSRARANRERRGQVPAIGGGATPVAFRASAPRRAAATAPLMHEDASPCAFRHP